MNDHSRGSSQPWINGLTLQRQRAEHAFMHATQRLARKETIERFETERKLAHRQRAFGVEAALAQSHQMLRQVVIRAVDDAQIVLIAALTAGCSRRPGMPSVVGKLHLEKTTPRRAGR